MGAVFIASPSSAHVANMFSPRFLAIFALVATVAASPASDRPAIPQPITTINNEDVSPFSFPWLSFSPMELFAPLFKFIPSFAELGPRISTDDDKFQVFIQAKDYKKDDLKVKVKGDFILVQGSHETKEDDHDLFASQFFHTYSLPVNASSADVTAELTSDGILVVSAPLSSADQKSQEADREVPIVETGAPLQKEEKVDKTTTAEPETVTEAKNEPTTPTVDVTTEVDVTEKDNDIPHGNEISP